jgi:2-C-methyl-D-erythritol 4-phosphate cytidylyltransferase
VELNVVGGARAQDTRGALASVARVMPGVWAIVVAGGGGRRFGRAKQFEDLAGRRVLDWSLAVARATCEGVVAVLPADRLEPGASAGGATRSASVRAGLAAVPAAARVVVVHDAARPLAGPALFERVVAAVDAGADGAVPGIALADTVKRVDGHRVTATVDRDDLVAVQTPQAFRADVLRAAHGARPEATDDAALVEALGGTVVVVEGDRRNFKITSPDDLFVARALVGDDDGPEMAGGG